MGVLEAPSGHNRDVLFNKPRQGSEDGVEAAKKKNEAAHKTRKERISVADGCSVTTIAGVVRRSGEELTQAEVGGPVNLDQLAKIGVVIHLTESEFLINTGQARHVIGRKAIIGAKKIHDVGEVVQASDFDKPDEPSFSFTTSEGHHKTAEAIKHPSGEETLRRLVKAGWIEERKTRAKVQAAIKAARGE
jgi:hypothetical protein